MEKGGWRKEDGELGMEKLEETGEGNLRDKRGGKKGAKGKEKGEGEEEVKKGRGKRGMKMC